MSILEQKIRKSSLHHEILGGISGCGTELKLLNEILQKSMEISLPRGKRSNPCRDETVEGYEGQKF